MGNDAHIEVVFKSLLYSRGHLRAGPGGSGGFGVVPALRPVVRFGLKSQQRISASFLAKKKLEEIQAWSRSYHKTQPFSDWGPHDGLVTATDPEFPGFTVISETALASLDTPCSGFEGLYAAGDRRQIRSSARTVRIRVEWSDRHLELYSLIAAPTRESATLTVSPTSSVPSPLNKDASVDFQVTAIDNLGHSLPDLKFRWRVRGSGNGTLAPHREGISTQFTNVVNLPAPIGGYYTGLNCQLEAVARHRGRELTATSATLELAR